MTQEPEERLRQDESLSGFRETMIQIRAWQAGDDVALDALFRRYYPVIRRIVAWRMNDTVRQLTDVDDLVQDALLKALRRIEQFEEQSDATFKSWLAKIVENQIKDELRDAHADRRDFRRERRFAADSEHGPTPSGIAGGEGTPSYAAMMGEMLAAEEARDQRREAVIAELEPTYREILNLRENCGMSFVEMAAELGKKADTVRMMYRRVVQKIEQRLGGES